MKTAAKVFTIIGMIFGFFLIYPIVLGVICLRKLEEAKSREDIFTWAIINIFLVSFLGGIFMLLIGEDELGEASVIDAPSVKKTSSAAEKLVELKKLYDDGVITEAEYQEKKQKYVDQL